MLNRDNRAAGCDSCPSTPGRRTVYATEEDTLGDHQRAGSRVGAHGLNRTTRSAGSRDGALGLNRTIRPHSVSRFLGRLGPNWTIRTKLGRPVLGTSPETDREPEEHPGPELQRRKPTGDRRSITCSPNETLPTQKGTTERAVQHCSPLDPPGVPWAQTSFRESVAAFIKKAWTNTTHSSDASNHRNVAEIHEQCEGRGTAPGNRRRNRR